MKQLQSILPCRWRAVRKRNGTNREKVGCLIAVASQHNRRRAISMACSYAGPLDNSRAM